MSETVPIQLTYQKIAAFCMCACGRTFEGFGEEGERAMEAVFESHADMCPAAKALDQHWEGDEA